jgi:hypothetical protein
LEPHAHYVGPALSAAFPHVTRAAAVQALERALDFPRSTGDGATLVLSYTLQGEHANVVYAIPTRANPLLVVGTLHARANATGLTPVVWTRGEVNMSTLAQLQKQAHSLAAQLEGHVLDSAHTVQVEGVRTHNAELQVWLVVTDTAGAVQWRARTQVPA